MLLDVGRIELATLLVLETLVELSCSYNCCRYFGNGSRKEEYINLTKLMCWVFSSFSEIFQETMVAENSEVKNL